MPQPVEVSTVWRKVYFAAAAVDLKQAITIAGVAAAGVCRCTHLKYGDQLSKTGQCADACRTVVLTAAGPTQDSNTVITYAAAASAHLYYLWHVLLHLLGLGVRQQHTTQRLHSRSGLRQVLL